MDGAVVSVDFNQISSVYAGDVEISAVWKGSTRIWQEPKPSILVGLTSGANVIIEDGDYGYSSAVKGISSVNGQLIGHFQEKIGNKQNIASLKDVKGDILVILQCGFNACTSLTSIEFPNLTAISDLGFWNCSNLSVVSRAENLQSVGRLAFYKSQISALVAPKLSNIGEDAFSNCSNLKVLNLSSVTSITNVDRDAFSMPTKLSAYIPTALYADWSDDTKNNNWKYFLSGSLPIVTLVAV